MALVKYLQDIKSDCEGRLQDDIWEIQRLAVAIERRRILAAFNNYFTVGGLISPAELVKVVNNEGDAYGDNDNKDS